MDVLLNNLHWKLKGYWPWIPLKETSMETGQKLMGVTDWIDAKVPGGVHYDLYRAGLIENPYHGLNSLKCEWVENRWWMYNASFERPQSLGEKCELIFKGLDYEALVYLNNIFLGEHEGMYEPAVFDVTSIVKANKNLNLTLVFKNAPQEMSQIGRTSLTHTQKSRFNYKWDFSTRLVNIGLWDDVILRVHKDYSIDQVSCHTDVENGMGIISLEAGIVRNMKENIEGEKLRLKVECLDSEGNKAAESISGLLELSEKVKLQLKIQNPELWYPNGYGQQPLYNIKVTLFRGEENVDERSFKAGIRKLEYALNEESPEGALPYTFMISGKKIYVKGVNMTPLDHLYGTVTPAHYEWLVSMMKNANVNMVRVWGGGIIEKEVFYDICDRNGIMIWQEFIQSSSGVDNIPSKNPKFLKLLRATAVSALKERRNHVALTVWSGGNELMSAPNRPSTYEDENIAMLKALVEEYDPQRLFLPTSASGPVEFTTTRKGVSHDVHGDWKYRGNPIQYEFFGQSDSLFHSEFGCDGLSSMKTLRKFLSEENQTVTTMVDNYTWRHHGEWWDTFSRDTEVFGEMPSLDIFSKCSQWMQSEGLKFILEANRRRQFKNSGSIIWQLNEPWPNVSCTNLVDYYGEPKMAYYWVKNAFAPIQASLDYRKLNYEEGEQFKVPVFAVGNLKENSIEVKCTVLDIKGNIIYEQEMKGHIPENKAVNLGELSFRVEAFDRDIFFVRLSVKANNTLVNENINIFSTRKKKIYGGSLELVSASIEASALNEWSKTEGSSWQYNSMISRTYEIENTGTEVALFIHPEEATNAYWMKADESYIILFPEEKKIITVSCVEKCAGGFLEEDKPKEMKSEPEIVFKSFID